MKKILVWMAALALVAAGCASETAQQAQEDPKGTLVGALEAMGETAGQSVTLTLASDTASLQALGADSGDTLSAEDAQKILDSSLTISANSAEDPADARAEFTMNIAGLEDAVAMKVIGTSFYLRADVRGLAEEFGLPAAQLQQMEAYGQQSGLTFIQPAIDGEWLAITGLDKLAQSMGVPSPAATNDAQAKATKELTEAVKELATVTSAGEDDAGAHLVATLAIRKLYERFVTIAQGAFPLPGPVPPASEIPDENVKVDVWVDDDRVTQVEFDFLQIQNFVEGEEIPEGVEQLALRMTLADFDGEVEAPADAVEVDPQQVIQTLFGGMGATTGTSSVTAPAGKVKGGSGDFPCEYLKGEPREVLLQFKKECPELLEKSG
ncbi:MAG: hypothetical protein ABR575_04780 [Actinomycetota bacterium]